MILYARLAMYRKCMCVCVWHQHLIQLVNYIELCVCVPNAKLHTDQMNFIRFALCSIVTSLFAIVQVWGFSVEQRNNEHRHNAQSIHTQ